MCCTHSPSIILSHFSNIQVFMCHVMMMVHIISLVCDELLVTKGTPAAYTLNDIGIQLGARPGDFYIDNTIAQQITFISLSPEDNNGNARPIGDVGDINELLKLVKNDEFDLDQLHFFSKLVQNDCENVEHCR